MDQPIKSIQLIKEINQVNHLAEAFVVEAVHLRDLSRLVVPSNQRDAIWVSHLRHTATKQAVTTTGGEKRGERDQPPSRVKSTKTDTICLRA